MKYNCIKKGAEAPLKYISIKYYILLINNCKPDFKLAALFE